MLCVNVVLGMAIALLIQSFNFMAADTSGGFAIFALALYLIFFSTGVGPGALYLIPCLPLLTQRRRMVNTIRSIPNMHTSKSNVTHNIH